MAALIALLWPDASQDDESDIASLLRIGRNSHSGPWTAAALAVLLIATAPEEFGVPECATTLEQLGCVRNLSSNQSAKCVQCCAGV